MADGDRTRDNRNHNPGLYRLSYGHHICCTSALAHPAGIEPATPGLEGRCSIRLSYGRMVFFRQKNGRGREIRTPDTLVPNQVRYQTALYPDTTYCGLCLVSGAHNIERFHLRQPLLFKYFNFFLED